jgi:beta-lactam-binding protein with PASTA domain
MTTVPYVSGFDPKHAAEVLRNAGFNPQIGATVDSGNPRGSVAYTSPSSGAQLGTGSSVTIYISDGTPYVAPQPPSPKPKPKPGGGDQGPKPPKPQHGHGNGQR